MLTDLTGSFLSDLGRDVFYSLRRIIKAPGFATVGIISLAIGIGLCSLVFAQLNALLLRPLPGASDPSGLVSLQRPVPYPFFETYRDQGDFAVAAAAFIGPVPFGVATESAGQSERVFGHLISPEYFATLGVVPQSGRLFAPTTERPGSEPVVVVSDRFWQTRLDADPGVIGRTLRVNGQALTIVGIGPTDFRGIYPVNPADLFVPVTAGEAVAPELGNDALNNRELNLFRVVFRLAPGVTMDSAEAALDVATRALEADDPEPDQEREGRQTMVLSAEGVAPITQEQRTLTLGSNLVLLGMVLTLVCGNLATLLLARASERRREVAIRLSLGANQFRLVRQLVTEAVVISLAGGVAGLFVAQWMVRLSESLTPAGAAPVELNMSVDLPLLAFTFAVSVLAGFGFGLLPAIATARTDITSALKGGDQSLRRYRRFGIRNLLVVYQVAGALTLLLVTGWVVLGYQRSASIDPGFDTSDLYLLTVDPPRDGFTPERSAILLDRLQERLPGLPEVSGLTLTASPPFASLAVVPNFRVSVTQLGSDTRVQHSVLRRRVGAGYFSALGIPIVRGREIEERDQPDAPTSGSREVPVVLNEAAAAQLFPDGNPLGRQIQAAAGDEVVPAIQFELGAPSSQGTDGDDSTFTVVGVSQDVKSAFLNAEAVPTMFWPITGESFARSSSQGTTIALRAAPTQDAVSAVRQELELLFPELTVFNVRSMNDHVNQFNTVILASSVINGGIGVFGLILAAIGLAGVTTHAVSRRRKEIGIRIALGARGRQVLQLVLRESIVLVIIGAAMGFAGAAVLARVFAAATAEFARIMAMGTGDPALLVGAPVLLVTLALIACYLPARRSTRIDPLSALREE